MPQSAGVDSLAERLRASVAVPNGLAKPALEEAEEEDVESTGEVGQGDSQCELASRQSPSPPRPAKPEPHEEDNCDSQRRHRRKPSRPQNLRSLHRKPGPPNPASDPAEEKEDDEDEEEEEEDMAALPLPLLTAAPSPPPLQPSPVTSALNLSAKSEPGLLMQQLHNLHNPGATAFDEHGALDLSCRPTSSNHGAGTVPMLPGLFPLPPPPPDAGQGMIQLIQAQLAAHFFSFSLPQPGSGAAPIPGLNPASPSQLTAANNSVNNNNSPLPSASTGANSSGKEEGDANTTIKTETSQEMKMAETQQAHTIRFANYEECGNEACARAGLKDHCHCTTCNKVLPRRDDLIRHMRWHIKREHALENGFMRFSAGDDCERPACTHKHRQTHYHCIRPNCDKVYISTSDCQMHSNYHKKYAALLEKGFLRFRASDDCREPSCPFRNDRTTHFHCTRKDCNYYFKNKADCEKHSTHHNRNDSLAKENFRKFLKYEDCLFAGCKYNRTMNHIHCLVTGCNYVVHSMGQTLPHKRKHERRGEVGPVEDGDNDSFAMGPNAATQAPILNLSAPRRPREEEEEQRSPVSPPNGAVLTEEEEEGTESLGDRLRALEQSGVDLEGSLSLPIPASEPGPGDEAGQDLRREVLALVEAEERAEGWKRFLRRFTANDACVPHCPMLYQDHYHCQAVPACRETFKTREKVREHARGHSFELIVAGKAFRACEEACAPEPHLHCVWPGCGFVSDTGPGPDLPLLSHYKTHDAGHPGLASSRKRPASEAGTGPLALTPGGAGEAGGSGLTTPRRRGRPPKHNKNVVVPRPDVHPDQVTEEPGRATLSLDDFLAAPNGVFAGFKAYPAGAACPDDKCQFSGKLHFHCLRPRCYHASNTLNEVNLHRNEFHAYMSIQEGFEFFDNHVCCRRSHCHNSKTTRHYHCTRRNCDYAFVRHNTMEQHAKRHLAADAAAQAGHGLSKPELPVQQPQQQQRPPAPGITMPIGANAVRPGLPPNLGGVRPPMPLPMSQCAALAAAMMAQGTFTGGMDMTILSKHLQSVIAANLGMPLGPNLPNMMPPSSMPPLLPIPEVVPRCHFAAEACPRLACAFKAVEHFHCGLCDQGCLDSLLLASHVAETHPGAILAPPLLPPPVMLKRAGGDTAFPPPPLKRLIPDAWDGEAEDEPMEADDEEEEEEEEERKEDNEEDDEGEKEEEEEEEEEREDGGSSSAPRSAAEEEEEEEEVHTRFLSPDSACDVHGFDFFPADGDCLTPDCEFARRSAHFHCTRCPYICADRKKSLAHSYRHLDP